MTSQQKDLSAQSEAQFRAIFINGRFKLILTDATGRARGLLALHDSLKHQTLIQVHRNRFSDMCFFAEEIQERFREIRDAFPNEVFDPNFSIGHLAAFLEWYGTKWVRYSLQLGVYEASSGRFWIIPNKNPNIDTITVWIYDANGTYSGMGIVDDTPRLSLGAESAHHSASNTTEDTDTSSLDTSADPADYNGTPSMKSTGQNQILVHEGTELRLEFLRGSIVNPTPASTPVPPEINIPEPQEHSSHDSSGEEVLTDLITLLESTTREYFRQLKVRRRQSTPRAGTLQRAGTPQGAGTSQRSGTPKSAEASDRSSPLPSSSELQRITTSNLRSLGYGYRSPTNGSVVNSDRSDGTASILDYGAISSQSPNDYRRFVRRESVEYRSRTLRLHTVEETPEPEEHSLRARTTQTSLSAESSASGMTQTTPKPKRSRDNQARSQSKESAKKPGSRRRGKNDTLTQRAIFICISLRRPSVDTPVQFQWSLICADSNGSPEGAIQYALQYPTVFDLRSPITVGAVHLETYASDHLAHFSLELVIQLLDEEALRHILERTPAHRTAHTPSRAWVESALRNILNTNSNAARIVNPNQNNLDSICEEIKSTVHTITNVLLEEDRLRYGSTNLPVGGINRRDHVPQYKLREGWMPLRDSDRRMLKKIKGMFKNLTSKF